jgi:PhnB protein
LPYIFFAGDAEDALAFYAAAGLGEVTNISRYAENAPASVSGVPMAGKIMHSRISRAGTDLFMLSDGIYTEPGGEMKRAQLSIGLNDLAEANRLFAALSQGGEVTMPMAKQFWGADFGMFKDRFGIAWMVNCDEAPA